MTFLYCLACSIVAFGLGVGLSNLVKSGVSALFTKAEADVKAKIDTALTKKV